ncbi:ABC transporter ATP-binding protein [Opitutales bacterium ASA1]|uniref:ABC transporter ATP-binding protein n=1 Tax=Congregicoccus parvus TaxID=3081749 RepID=UPI002B2E1E8D|nr:ABC transporter ATP-binding protein [Opitutales bacterium ASA1]
MVAIEKPLLEARGLRKVFGEQVVLEDVSLAVPAGAVVSVLGKSGTGKSVFLKCLAGILTPERGEIRFEGEPMRKNDREARADFRSRCSYLFQHNALLDSLSALENVALPLEQTTRLSRREFTARAREVLRSLELDEFRDRYPSQLSGGMQKRLALARAIVTRPQLVLFDEPTAGLDPLRRNAVFAMIARYQRELGFTAVLVTHDLDEALVASDRVALLDGGRMRFEGTPAEFRACRDEAVSAFRDSVAHLKEELQALRAAPGRNVTS